MVQFPRGAAAKRSSCPAESRRHTAQVNREVGRVLDSAPQAVEKITREQMVTEFGGPGVENAKVVDLISVDELSGKVVLTMIERRPWGASDRQFQQIEEKINRYMGYALDGFLAEHYPQYEGKGVQIRLECAEEPHGDAVLFVQAAARAATDHGLEFAVVVKPAAV
jgi:hypothetical protein